MKGQRKLRKIWLYVYSLLNIFKVMQPTRVRCARHAARSRHIYMPIYTSSSSSCSLSDDRFKPSSKTIPPHIAIQSFILQMRVSSSVLKVIQ